MFRKSFNWNDVQVTLAIHAINTINTNTYNTFNTHIESHQITVEVIAEISKSRFQSTEWAWIEARDTNPFLAAMVRRMEANAKGRRSRWGVITRRVVARLIDHWERCRGAGRKPPPGQRKAGWATQFQDFFVNSSAGWATLYNRIGVVKRHVERQRVLSFPFVESLCFCRCSSLSLMPPRLAFRIPGWNLVPPTIYPVLLVRP
jgi:hypothetical protein